MGQVRFWTVLKITKQFHYSLKAIAAAKPTEWNLSVIVTLWLGTENALKCKPEERKNNVDLF